MGDGETRRETTLAGFVARGGAAAQARRPPRSWRQQGAGSPPRAWSGAQSRWEPQLLLGRPIPDVRLQNCEPPRPSSRRRLRPRAGQPQGVWPVFVVFQVKNRSQLGSAGEARKSRARWTVR